MIFDLKFEKMKKTYSKFVNSIYGLLKFHQSYNSRIKKNKTMEAKHFDPAREIPPPINLEELGQGKIEKQKDTRDAITGEERQRMEGLKTDEILR